MANKNAASRAGQSGAKAEKPAPAAAGATTTNDAAAEKPSAVDDTGKAEEAKAAPAAAPKPAAPAKVAKPAGEPTYTVEDKTMMALPVEDPTVRKHEIKVGDRFFTHAFSRNKPTPMPQSHALKFLGIQDIEVRDEKDQVIRLKQVEDVEGKPGIVLGPGQVVADLAELTREALMARAEGRPNHEALGGSPTKNELVAFLTALTVDAEAGSERVDAEMEVDD